jgi:hypothetical protein
VPSEGPPARHLRRAADPTRSSVSQSGPLKDVWRSDEHRSATAAESYAPCVLGDDIPDGQWRIIEDVEQVQHDDRTVQQHRHEQEPRALPLILDYAMQPPSVLSSGHPGGIAWR